MLMKKKLQDKKNLLTYFFFSNLKVMDLDPYIAEVSLAHDNLVCCCNVASFSELLWIYH